MPVVRFPMQPYPTSWYRVADSTDLVHGQIRRMHYFGRDLIAYRTLAGEVRVADAHCPHLGADLGPGRIEGDEVVCPFHGWRFDATGSCVEIPYAKKIPGEAKLRSYQVAEFDGVVAVYYDELERNPGWSVPPMTGGEDERQWTPFARKVWQIRTHVQDIVENGPDVAHQVVVHNAVDIPEMEYEIDGVTIAGTMIGKYDFPGGPAGGVRVVGHFSNIGLGITNIRLTDHLDGVEISRQLQLCRTPIDGILVEASIAQRTKSLGDIGMADAMNEKIVQATWEDFEKDIPIWENKIYRSLPSRTEFNRGEKPAVLCQGEGAIVKFRNWSRQFYTDAECGV